MAPNQELLRSGMDLFICACLATAMLLAYRQHVQREQKRVPESDIETAAFALYRGVLRLTSAPGESIDPWLVMNSLDIFPTRPVQRKRVRIRAFELGLLTPKLLSGSGLRVSIPLDGPYGLMSLQAERIGEEVTMNGDIGVVINAPGNTIHTVNVNSYPPEIMAELLAELKRLASDTRLDERDRAVTAELFTELDNADNNKARLQPLLAKVKAASTAASSGFDAVNAFLRLLGYK